MWLIIIKKFYLFHFGNYGYAYSPGPKNSNRGITLMELLVTLALLSIVSLSLFTIFRTTTESYSKGDARVQYYQNARAVLAMVKRDITSAIICTNDFGDIVMYCIGFPEGDSNRIMPDTAGAEFYFVAAIGSGGDDKSELCEVGYWLDGKDEKNKVLRRYYVTDDRKTETNKTENLDFDCDDPRYPTESIFHTKDGGSLGSPDKRRNLSPELALNITRLEFLYWGDDTTTWNTNAPSHDDRPLTDWDSRTDGLLPLAVKVIFDATDEKGKETNTFSTVVWLPNAQ